LGKQPDSRNDPGGDELQMFRHIVQEHQDRIFRLALSMTGDRAGAEDITQDVFLRAYRAYPSFRNNAAVGTWLYRIAVNLSLDALTRKGKNSRNISDVLLDGDATFPSDRHEDDLERAAASSLLGEHVRHALDGLSPRERAVFVLRHYEDMPLKDVAATLSIRVGTVKSLLFRAMVKLQKRLSVYREEARI
jgi:RNA polymerase sigma-70 factor, ECF subfamily